MQELKEKERVAYEGKQITVVQVLGTGAKAKIFLVRDKKGNRIAEVRWHYPFNTYTFFFESGSYISCYGIKEVADFIVEEANRRIKSKNWGKD